MDWRYWLAGYLVALAFFLRWNFVVHRHDDEIDRAAADALGRGRGPHGR